MARKKNGGEERLLNTWLPLGIMVGALVGVALFYKTGNYLYIAGCTVGGIIIGIAIGTSVETKPKKRKRK